MTTCTRRLEWDAAHRVLRHESKCAHLHGHRYVAEITCLGILDSVGRVIDFGVVKEVVGRWIDDRWDHGTLLNVEDESLLRWLQDNEQKHYVVEGEPTAEVLAGLLKDVAARELSRYGVAVVAVTVHETPNCWASA